MLTCLCNVLQFLLLLERKFSDENCNIVFISALYILLKKSFASPNFYQNL